MVFVSKIYIASIPKCYKVIVIMIMTIKKANTMEIDWDALDSCWADRYEEDYGYLSSGQYFT